MEIGSVLQYIAIIISIISLYHSIKNNKQNMNHEIKKYKLEEYKEAIRHNERKIDEMFMQINSRSNCIPFLYINLNGFKIEEINHNGVKEIKITICLINVGKDVAANIHTCYINEKDKMLYKSSGGEYKLYEYFNQNFAMSRDCVKFSIINTILNKDNDKKNCKMSTADKIEFKIRFNVLLGNLYEQEFNFTFYDFNIKNISYNNYSGIPHLIKNSTEE